MHNACASLRASEHRSLALKHLQELRGDAQSGEGIRSVLGGVARLRLKCPSESWEGKKGTEAGREGGGKERKGRKEEGREGGIGREGWKG